MNITALVKQFCQTQTACMSCPFCSQWRTDEFAIFIVYFQCYLLKCIAMIFQSSWECLNRTF